jgi:hypothetical protein
MFEEVLWVEAAADISQEVGGIIVVLGNFKLPLGIGSLIHLGSR